MKETPMEIRLRTLTPIWTGGVDGMSDRLHETGLIGSLRWWYEALVRGLGGYACDPTGDDRCTYDPNIGPACICHACQLFGCTGWARRFRLVARLRGEEGPPLFLVSQLPTNQWWLKEVYRQGSRPVFGDVNLAMTGMGLEPVDLALHGLLQVMADGVGLGAKLQHGFGQFGIVGAPASTSAYALLRELAGREARAVEQDGFARWNELWTLDFAISATDDLVRDYLNPRKTRVVGDAEAYEHHKARYIPCAFDLRYKLGQDSGLRQYLRFAKDYGKERARVLFGYTSGDDDRQASRIGVSHLFKIAPGDQKYNLRVWGLTPDGEQVRRDVQEHIQQLFPSARVATSSGAATLRRIQGVAS